jgi:phosphatidylserine/phosphatidylglycerophosphate/cardiolipin synthase-like enzyme
VDFAMFTFAQSSGIDETMIRLVGDDLAIRGVLGGAQGAQKWVATRQLSAAGVELHKNRAGTGVRKVHHKLMVIDDQRIILGSCNYTGPATTLNDENMVVIGDLEETDPAAQADQRKLAGFGRVEIDRIIDELAQPI